MERGFHEGAMQHDGETVRDVVRARRAALTRGEDRAAAYLVGHYPAAGLGPMARFARAAGTSPQTVLRLLAKLDIAGWEALQERLRAELAAEQASPLGRWSARSAAPEPADWLGAFAARIVRTVEGSFAGIAPSEFEAAAALLADGKRNVAAVGGRFTQPVATLLARHLQIVRGGVRDFDAIAATWPDRLIDVDRRTVAVVFDVRRYARDTAAFARAAAGQGATLIAVTDDAAAPVARLAAFRLVGRPDAAGVWDSLAAQLAIAEALVARVTELCGAGTADRLARIEAVRELFDDGA